MQSDELDTRLIALESSLAQLQDTCDELSDEVRRQSEEIDRLQAAVRVLSHERLIETEGEAETHIRHKG